ncbi:MAG: hypothetical protein NUV77_18075 [Thermoguttaceae bacterium]|jgi:hypothetical protein|nr:hypothetical protein [Thermoguttaceae bacterium]
MEPDDEAAISEITILPDGRVCVFGASEALIALLAALDPRDAGIRRRAAPLGRPRAEEAHELRQDPAALCRGRPRRDEEPTG